ncbi:alpha/beta hydrolase [Streptomyces sp. TRM68416]|uniref:alpha/beta hydrolase n=1 Tax=Streptomyces sp. TRM68416 TaxID=2758412 RepID=UPI0016621296|nr:alpha/beta hydrolase [Streptomyces sp. TRM68416]MBD0839764.1 alpha/beta hydrolase [Streptomyces sp. TRM68416]
MRPRLVFVHGVGRPLDADAKREEWRRALADGARAAGHSRSALDLFDRPSPDIRFAYYGDLFPGNGVQGAVARPTPEDEELAGMLLEAVDDRLRAPEDAHEARVLRRARTQLAPEGEPQGAGAVLRQTLAAANTLLSLPGLRTVGGWTSARMMVHVLRQVRQYLARGHADEAGVGLDRRIRDRVAAELDPDGPTVVVAHSLGTVVAYETLHEHRAPVPLFVTLGSPIGMRAAVQPRMRPRPLRTPERVGGWLDFWDRDDFVTAGPEVARCVAPNTASVAPVSRRVDSDGAHVHPAAKYLAQPGVAGPVVEALSAVTAR